MKKSECLYFIPFFNLNLEAWNNAERPKALLVNILVAASAVNAYFTGSLIVVGFPLTERARK